MAHAVFIHRPDSIYDDVPSERYQFPRQYLSRIEPCVGDWIVYLEPSKILETRGYFAVARVSRIIPDPTQADMFIAVIEPGSYLDFGSPVPFRGPDGWVEHGVLNAAGRLSGRAQAAVRLLSREDFARIVDLGLEVDADDLPRRGEAEAVPGFAEGAATFQTEQVRDRTQLLGSRLVRDRNFRRMVVRAYDGRCAFSGLRLINGGGRAEVEAAHIRPVEENGPDLLVNGVALSGTAHWMFDRGLIGVGDDLTLLVSRQVNDADAVRGLMNPTGALLAPRGATDRPDPRFLAWHREHRFKH